jgi:hypothetical protein
MHIAYLVRQSLNKGQGDILYQADSSDAVLWYLVAGNM